MIREVGIYWEGRRETGVPGEGVWCPHGLIGKATVGKELFHSLRATSTQGRPQLRVMQFPVNINNRIAYGPYWGGPFLRACFFLRFEVQKRALLCHIVLLQFP